MSWLDRLDIEASMGDLVAPLPVIAFTARGARGV